MRFHRIFIVLAISFMSLPLLANYNVTNKKMGVSGIEQATFGGGCFWCIEAIFEQVQGVKTVVSGYTGGAVKNPTYREVTSGLSGHAEAIQVTFDPDSISYLELLEIFFKTHDPTTLNRQGADVGTQYRSAVFYHNQEQKDQAEKVLKELDFAGIWNDPIVTQIESFSVFYEAEKYHQEYYKNNSNQSYCRVVTT